MGFTLGSLIGIALLLIEVLVVAVVAYFVIKKAVKDALKEYNNDKK